MLKYLLFVLLATFTQHLSFNLGRNRSYCFMINGERKYDFEFVVSGQGEQNVVCQIFEGSKILKSVQYKSEYQTELVITEKQGNICFESLDGLPKQVSFDFIESDDPLKSTFTQSRKQRSHEILYHAYEEMNRLYRDQHFMLQRKHVHTNVLNEAQNKLLTITIAKIIIIAMATAIQLYLIKKIVDGEFTLYSNKN